ncbi:thionin-like protein 2 [Olea europaea var. sylvestris]|uniref:thionin-like protein 2 n=1 Tax=Olea europaea var. sylvestris TaxID=158386 RepID=UPI000C1D36C9|nr:thionin-like protein 2 [Olea europaea var. sylvestris]
MMELRILRAVVLVLALGMLTGQSCASFKDCYTKCFIFCMIEPSETLCSCTTHCLKQCIFSDSPQGVHEDKDNLGFCKLGCAFSMCSTISTKRKPNGEKVDNCVGSCSTKCTKSYSLP